jgi:hypothetical protein
MFILQTPFSRLIKFDIEQWLKLGSEKYLANTLLCAMREHFRILKNRNENCSFLSLNPKHCSTDSSSTRQFSSLDHGPTRKLRGQSNDAKDPKLLQQKTAKEP